jgi:hypothetical protein
MVHPSSRFYRCLCQVLIASMLFQTGCFSTRTKYTHNPSYPKPALLESGSWDLEVELRDGSLIKVTPLNSKFGEALYVETQQVRGELVSWDEETIRLKRVRVPFRAKKFADVFYDIPVAEARQITFFNKAEKGFDPGKTVLAVAAILTLAYILTFAAVYGFNG